MNNRKTAVLALLPLVLLAASAAAGQRPAYPWPGADQGQPLSERIAPPPGFQREAAPPGSFAAWLRGLPLREGCPDVLLFDGRKKANQRAQWAVLAIDTGPRDLQQCADAVIRLRAEYLFSQGLDSHIAFRFTSGDLVPWARWRGGERVRVRGNSVSWFRGGEEDGSYANFRRWLDLLFTYAGTASLARELLPVARPAEAAAGDVFIQGGFPGHAVLVADAAVNAAGGRMLLLLQSYMPAQDVHVLRNPADADSPWYAAAAAGELVTPEWTFARTDARRFPLADGR